MPNYNIPTMVLIVKLNNGLILSLISPSPTKFPRGDFLFYFFLWFLPTLPCLVLPSFSPTYLPLPILPISLPTTIASPLLELKKDCHSNSQCMCFECFQQVLITNVCFLDFFNKL